MSGYRATDGLTAVTRAIDRHFGRRLAAGVGPAEVSVLVDGCSSGGGTGGSSSTGLTVYRKGDSGPAFASGLPVDDSGDLEAAAAIGGKCFSSGACVVFRLRSRGIVGNTCTRWPVCYTVS